MTKENNLYLQALRVFQARILQTDVKVEPGYNVSGGDLHKHRIFHQNPLTTLVKLSIFFFFFLLYLFSTLRTGFSGSCLKPPDKTGREMGSRGVRMMRAFLQFASFKTLNSPFIVENVSAVDRSNVPGVIQEVGADGALCPDRHVRHGSSNWHKNTKPGLLFFWHRYLLRPNPAVVRKKPRRFADKAAGWVHAWRSLGYPKVQ